MLRNSASGARRVRRTSTSSSERRTGDLYYDEDGTSSIKKELIAELDKGLKLKPHHFEADFVA